MYVIKCIALFTRSLNFLLLKQHIIKCTEGRMNEYMFT